MSFFSSLFGLLLTRQIIALAFDLLSSFCSLLLAGLFFGLRGIVYISFWRWLRQRKGPGVHDLCAAAIDDLDTLSRRNKCSDSMSMLSLAWRV